MSKKRTKSSKVNRVQVLFGRDENGKPRAARFPGQNANIVARAARIMGLRTSATSYAQHANILRQLPLGKLYRDGRALVPIASDDTYALISKAMGGDLGHISPNAPKSWEEIAAGSLVLAQDSAATGWYEAVIVERDGEHCKIKWRDYWQEEPAARPLSALALVHPTP